MLKTFFSFLLRLISPTPAAPLPTSDVPDFSTPPKVRVKRKLAEIYRDEVAKRDALHAVDLTGYSTGAVARHLQSIATAQARVNMYKARLESQSPTV
jgi:hypothetical protein